MNLRAALDWMAPYASGTKQWDAGAQIRPFDPSVFATVYRAAAVAYPAPANASYADIAARPPNATSTLANLAF